ncbi:MAG: PAS domain-containing protein [Opitutaceae bacterium]|nr:PAS domain-containing protein [Cytophagales bacterium]
MLDEEIIKLQKDLEEALELIDAIRTGAIDALAVNNSDGPQIFTLKGADLSYRMLVEKMNEGALILNKEGLILYSNTSISNFLGIPLKSLIGSSFLSFIDPENLSNFRTLLDNGWNTHSRGEFMMRNQEEIYVPFYFSMSMIEMENEPALGVIITNLSTKNEIKAIRNKVAEQNSIIEKKDLQIQKDREAKEEATRLAIVLEGLPQMAWTANTNGAVNYYNQRWYDYTGTSPEQTLVWGWKSIVHPDLLDNTVDAWRDAVETGNFYEMETLFKRASDQTYRWHLVRARPIRNERNEIVLWVGTCTDMHDQKETLEQLANATAQLKIYNKDLTSKNEELIKTNTDLDNFLYLASHDLKAPISNIEGLLNAFFNDVEVDEEYKPMVEMMFTSVNRFKKTILDLTEISKVHKDDQHELELLELNDIFNEVTADIKDLINRKKAIIKTDFKIPSLRYYRKILRSTVYNLLSNAIKYSDSTRTPEIVISTGRINKSDYLKVEDNGLGLTHENLQKIFKMFNRIHTHEEGSGIGLYIVKRMIENVGGKIEVESEPGKGSSFMVYLN